MTCWQMKQTAAPSVGSTGAAGGATGCAGRGLRLLSLEKDWSTCCEEVGAVIVEHYEKLRVDESKRGSLEPAEKEIERCERV